MAYQSIYFFTDLPVEIIEIVHKDLEQHYDEQMKDSRLHGDLLNKEKRNSKNTWIPTHHWIAGWLWHYVQKANKTNPPSVTKQDNVNITIHGHPDASAQQKNEHR